MKTFEQFEIILIIKDIFINLDISITNAWIILLIVMFTIMLIKKLIIKKTIILLLIISLLCDGEDGDNKLKFFFFKFIMIIKKRRIFIIKILLTLIVFIYIHYTNSQYELQQQIDLVEEYKYLLADEINKIEVIKREIVAKQLNNGNNIVLEDKDTITERVIKKIQSLYKLELRTIEKPENIDLEDKDTITERVVKKIKSLYRI